MWPARSNAGPRVATKPAFPSNRRPLTTPTSQRATMADLNVITICGSLRKGSFTGMVRKALPGLAPAGMTIKEAPSFAEFPLYNADIQNSTGFPAPVNALADAIRAADGVIFNTPEYNFSLP